MRQQRAGSAERVGGSATEGGQNLGVGRRRQDDEAPASALHQHSNGCKPAEEEHGERDAHAVALGLKGPLAVDVGLEIWQPSEGGGHVRRAGR